MHHTPHYSPFLPITHCSVSQFLSPQYASSSCCLLLILPASSPHLAHLCTTNLNPPSSSVQLMSLPVASPHLASLTFISYSASSYLPSHVSLTQYSKHLSLNTYSLHAPPHTLQLSPTHLSYTCLTPYLLGGGWLGLIGACLGL